MELFHGKRYEFGVCGLQVWIRIMPWEIPTLNKFEKHENLKIS